MKNQVGDFKNDCKEKIEQELWKSKKECNRLEGELEIKEDECEKIGTCSLLRRQTYQGIFIRIES